MPLPERRAERFRFETPIAALFGSHPVVLSDLSVSGAGIIHREQFGREGERLLTFAWDGLGIELISSVVRTALERKQHDGIALTVYHSGVQFGQTESPTARGPLASHLDEALARQKANAFGISIESARHLPLLSFDAEETRNVSPSLTLNLNDFFVTESSARRFVQCRLVRGCWIHETVETLEQPEDGFTVSGAETVEELETLCRTFQQSDQQGRNLIRTFAHLTLTEPPAIRRDLYTV